MPYIGSDNSDPFWNPDSECFDSDCDRGAEEDDSWDPMPGQD